MMISRSELINQLSSVNAETFDELALKVFHFQYNNNDIYNEFCNLIGRTPSTVDSPAAIPHLPIGMFKRHFVICNGQTPEVVFESSTTTGQTPSQHALCDEDLYKRTASRGYSHVMGSSIDKVEWLALLPSYLDRPNSSLIYMTQYFIEQGGGAFFNLDHQALADKLVSNEEGGVPSVLLGVSFALLDFVEAFQLDLKHTTVIETGGMKGKREELPRETLHQIFTAGLGVSSIGSEYGMTELTSQAWSHGNGVFQSSPTLRISTRQFNDPLSLCAPGDRGAINCTDLANIDTCAFIATDDIGVVQDNGEFEVLGRLDGSEQRGCNLMVENLLT